jgi:hypothetical protein
MLFNSKNLGRLLKKAGIIDFDCVKVGGKFTIECHDKDGNLRWKDTAKNLVVYEGLQHLLDVLFHGTTQVDPWYVGLTATTPSPANADVLTSHVGWTEFTDYTDNRKEYVDVRSSQTVSNTASKASFAINQDSSVIGGAFLCSVASGTSGTLLCCAAFSGGDKNADDGDTLSVTYEFSAADDGV